MECGDWLFLLKTVARFQHCYVEMDEQYVDIEIKWILVTFIISRICGSLKEIQKEVLIVSEAP